MKQSNNRRERSDNSRAPPPVVNKRFEQLAEEERERQREREDRRRGPPPVANSRFAAAAEADRSTYRDRNDRGPPPVANSRFAAAAEADRSYVDADFRRSGPPPTQNSRFAAAAAMAEEDRYRERDASFGRDRDGPYGRGPRGPPPAQNSRFAAAAAADEDYVERGDRDRYDGGDRFGNRDGGYDRRGGRDGYDRRGDRDDYGRNDRGRYEDQYEKPEEPPKSSVADLLKPKARPVEENILQAPTKEHADNFLKLPTKKAEESKEKEPAPSKPAEEPVSAPTVEVSKVKDDSDVIAEFISGNRLGEDLKSWVEEQVIPSVEKLVFTLLTETEKLNPDIECAWAEPTKYGAALVSLVQEDLLKQMDILFGIQKYCDKLGFPKLNEEYVVQAMFRSMYKYDLADEDAFSMWKEDESSEHEAGKLNAVIQTVDWFNWLEEDDDDDEEDEYYEE